MCWWRVILLFLHEKNEEEGERIRILESMLKKVEKGKIKRDRKKTIIIINLPTFHHRQKQNKKNLDAFCWHYFDKAEADVVRKCKQT